MFRFYECLAIYIVMSAETRIYRPLRTKTHRCIVSSCKQTVAIARFQTKVQYVHIFFFFFGMGQVTDSGTMLQTGRSRVRFSIRSLAFPIDLILPAATMSSGRLSL
jgi:hypothetical protein